MEKKNIEQIRKNITKRKQHKRQKITSSPAVRPHTYSGMEEEEKHGFFPFSSHTPTATSGDQLFIPAFVFKILIAAILFFATALVLRLETDALEKPRGMLLSALTEDFNFAKVQGWYRDNLGSPFAFLNNNSNIEHVNSEGLVLPVNGSITESFQETGEGVLIDVAAEGDMSVTAMEAGTVVFAGNKKETGKTIILQHADDSYSIYGHLHDIDVFHYQFVSKNDVIGTLKPGEGNQTASLYFAIKEDQIYVDPVQVIQVDDKN